ncbi:MAG: hypothetical protein WDN45_17285 [Caulobacteraceae bacterium]
MPRERQQEPHTGPAPGRAGADRRLPAPGEAVTRGPLELVWCPDSGLLQLGHSFDPQEMYGDNYGYRSGLNASMVRHLSQKIGFLEKAGPI